MAGFCIVRVPGIVRVIFRDTYPHYIGPPTVIIGVTMCTPTLPEGKKKNSYGRTYHIRLFPSPTYYTLLVDGIDNRITLRSGTLAPGHRLET